MRSKKVEEWRRERNGEKRADPRRDWGGQGSGEENDPLRTEVLAQLGHEWAARLALPLVLPIPTARQKEAQRRRKLGKGYGRFPVRHCPILQAPFGALREGLKSRQGSGRVFPAMARLTGGLELVRIQDSPPWTFLKVGPASVIELGEGRGRIIYGP